MLESPLTSSFYPVISACLLFDSSLILSLWTGSCYEYWREANPTEVRDPYQMKRKKKLTKKAISYCLEIEQNLVLLEQML